GPQCPAGPQHRRCAGGSRSRERAHRSPGRRFRDFMWTTRKSWSCRRRVVAKAEWTQGEANPRFVVTSLAVEAWAARSLYEDLYCALGEMANRMTECQLDLYADRTSAATMRANQLRFWFASMAYVLMCALRVEACNLRRRVEATDTREITYTTPSAERMAD